MITLASSFRDVRDFLAAKRRKREPLQWHAKGAACAEYVPCDYRGLERFRESLRGVGDWGRASERLDALEHALRRRHQCVMPLPRRIIQNEDRSLTVFWEGCMVRLFVDGLITMIGGVQGPKSRKVTRQFLDLLAFASRLQAAS